MTKCCLHQVDRRAALERVRRVSMAQPVRADLCVQTSPLGSAYDNAPDLRRVQMAALSRSKDRRIGSCAAAELDQRPPDAGSQQNNTCFGPLPEDRHLPAVITRLQIAPAEAGGF